MGEIIDSIHLGRLFKSLFMLANPTDPSAASSSSAFVPVLVTFSHVKFRELPVGVERLELAGTSLPMSLYMAFSVCRNSSQGCVSQIGIRVHYLIAC